MKKILLSLFVSVCIYVTALGQGAIGQDLEIPSQNKIGNQNFNQNIDLSTGIISPSLHLTELSSTTGYSVSVDLIYNSGQGVRVNDIASRVGLGWEIMTGGKIVRQVNGMPDEYPNGGWLANNYAYLWPLPIMNPRSFELPVNTTSTIAESYLKYLTSPNFISIPIQNSTNSLAIRAVILKRLMDKKYLPLDGEPDIFHFNVGGYSGKFLFDQNRKIVLLPHQDVRIEAPYPFSQTGGQDWIITTPDGVRHKFKSTDKASTKEYTMTSGTSWDDNIIREYTSEWNLSEVEVNGKIAFTFTYNTVPDYSILYSSENQLTYVGTQVDGQNCTENATFGSIPEIQDISSLQVIKQGKELFKVTSDIGEIIFESASGASYRRDRWYNSDHNYAFFPLKAIKKYTTEGTLLKNFEFDTDYFFGGVSYNHGQALLTASDFPIIGTPPAEMILWANYSMRMRANVLDRLKLIGIKEYSTNGNIEILNYAFEYNEANINISFTNHNNQDEWGFYKQNNFSGMPYPGTNPFSGIQFDGKTLPFLSGIPPITNPYIVTNPPYVVLTHNEPYPHGILGFDKSANGSIPGALVLSKIKFPNGGVTEYEFEQNDYYNAITTSNQLTGGIRIKKVRQIDSHVVDINSNFVETNYIYTNELQSTISSGQVALPRKKYNYQTYYCSADAYAIYFQKSSNDYRQSSSEIVRYSHVTVAQKGTGKIVNKFTNFSDYPDEPINRYFMPIHSRANYCDMHTSTSGFYPVGSPGSVIEVDIPVKVST
jgi:hypothetical protein